MLQDLPDATPASREEAMDRAIRSLRPHPLAAQAAPPHWAVVTVKLCVAGILLLPLATPLLLTASSALGDRADPFRFPAFVVSVVLWLALLTCAEIVTGHYPPVPRR
jgi:hypothetical protein